MTEDIKPDKRLREVCGDLKKAGYTVDHVAKHPPFRLADIVKADFRPNSADRCELLAFEQAATSRLRLPLVGEGESRNCALSCERNVHNETRRHCAQKS
jgi:hypothetical protein